MEGHELNSTRKQSEPFGKLYCRYFHDILSEFYPNDVSMVRCQILWLLGLSHIPKPWILKDREVLTYKGCRGNYTLFISKAETHYIFNKFVSMSRSRSIYVVYL